MLIKIAVEIEWMDWCNSILVWCGYGPCTKPESAKRGMEGLASTAGAATAESIVQQGNVVRQSIKPRFEQGVVVMLTLAVWNVNTHGNARQETLQVNKQLGKASFGGKKTDWREIFVMTTLLISQSKRGGERHKEIEQPVCRSRVQEQKQEQDRHCQQQQQQQQQQEQEQHDEHEHAYISQNLVALVFVVLDWRGAPVTGFADFRWRS